MSLNTQSYPKQKDNLNLILVMKLEIVLVLLSQDSCKCGCSVSIVIAKRLNSYYMLTQINNHVDSAGDLNFKMEQIRKSCKWLCKVFAVLN